MKSKLIDRQIGLVERTIKHIEEQMLEWERMRKENLEELKQLKLIREKLAKP
jgi:hypothetical protein